MLFSHEKMPGLGSRNQFLKIPSYLKTHTSFCTPSASFSVCILLGGLEGHQLQQHSEPSFRRGRWQMLLWQGPAVDTIYLWSPCQAWALIGLSVTVQGSGSPERSALRPSSRLPLYGCSWLQSTTAGQKGTLQVRNPSSALRRAVAVHTP